jgi:hypothetical protein
MMKEAARPAMMYLPDIAETTRFSTGKWLLIHERKVLQTRRVNILKASTRGMVHKETLEYIIFFSKPHRAIKPCARFRGLQQVCHLVENTIDSEPDPNDPLEYQCGSVLHVNES